MGTWLPETCSATIRREIKNTKSDILLVFFIHTLIQKSWKDSSRKCYG